MCVNKDQCSPFLSSSGNECQVKCATNEFILYEVEPTHSYQICKATCSTYQYLIDKRLYCADKCPDSAIIDETKKKCYASAVDCPFAASTDGLKCIDSCDASKKETIVDQGNGVKKCVECTDYYTPASGLV